ncbi:hypothetical protein ABW21_db0201578 [Orbilia brochopaga]|nr:hypothetical protein ABW21_db0201578 [Drechslerella brochopaga]
MPACQCALGKGCICSVSECFCDHSPNINTNIAHVLNPRYYDQTKTAAFIKQHQAGNAEETVKVVSATDDNASADSGRSIDSNRPDDPNDADAAGEIAPVQGVEPTVLNVTPSPCCSGVKDETASTE